MPIKLPEGSTAAYESSASCSFLAIKGVSSEQILGYQISMIQNERPEYLLKMDVRMENAAACFYYDVTSKLPLEFVLKRKKLKRDEFIRVLSDIARPLSECEAYLLTDTGFLLDAGLIYTDPETLKIYLPYLPARSDDNMSEAFKSFVAGLILNHATIEENGSDNFLQRILGLVKKDNFSIPELLGLLEELLCLPEPLLEEKDAGLNGFETAAAVKAVPPAKVKKGKTGAKNIRLPAALLAQVFIAAALLLCRRLFERIPGNTGVTYAAAVLIVLAVDILLFKNLFSPKPAKKAPQACEKAEKKPGVRPRPGPESKAGAALDVAYPKSRKAVPGSGGVGPLTAAAPSGVRMPIQGKTELLGSVKPGFPVLRSTNSAELEEIVIDKSEFLIGRLSGQVDHVCKNNAVGKMHALITGKAGNLCIRDLNSVNGTFVNDVRIDSNRDVGINDKDRIMLANSEYVLTDIIK